MLGSVVEKEGIGGEPVVGGCGVEGVVSCGGCG